MKKKPNNSKNLAKHKAGQTDSEDMDETSYLLSNAVNKKRLLDSINELNQAVYYNHKLIEYQECNT